VAGGDRLLGQPGRQALGVEVGTAAQDHFGAEVVAAGIEHQLGGAIGLGALEAVAAEGTGRFAHIGFAVIPFAEGEELEQLTGEVFVGVSAVAGEAVEGDLQSRIEHHRHEQLAVAAVEVAADGGDLALQQQWIGQLTPVHREHAQPELHLPEAALLRAPGELAEPAALQVVGLTALAGPALLAGQGAAGLGGGLHHRRRCFRRA